VALHIDPEDGLELLVGGDVHRCRVCGLRPATWKAPRRDTTEGIFQCAWCLLYAGSSWGYNNRNDILAMGIMIVKRAETNPNPKVHVPELDVRHRLPPADAEKLMLGVGYTSAHLRPSISKLMNLVRRAEPG